MSRTNLIPQAHVLTVGEASKGGKASGESRRRKRDMARLAAAMLEQSLQGKQDEQFRRLFPELSEEATVGAQMVAGQINAATKGNTKAAQFLFDLAERERTREEQEHVFSLSPIDLTRDCIEPYRFIHECFEGKHKEVRDIVFKGGRGGAKSTFGAEIAYETMMQDKNANVVYGRRFGSDLRHTVYQQFVRVIQDQGSLDEWLITRQPMKCTYKPTGTSVYFFGFENAEQLKSFTPEKGYVKLLIFEEADEMLGNEQMDSAADTFLRSNGFDDAIQLRLKIFNPPASKNNFMNEWVAELDGDPSCRIFDFSYLNVPRSWLGEQFFQRAEWNKLNKPDFYKNNYLGEVTGTGGELFANVAEEAITEEQVKEFEGHCYQGLDFGYEHPMAFIRAYYDQQTDTVYPFFEHVKQKCSLVEFCKGIDDYKQFETIADSAEPDRIADMRDMDFDVIKAVKRWGNNKGRAYSWGWLRTRSKIVVDPSRTPHLAKELRTLEFEKLKGGGYSSRLPDLNEDCVMALIYALNRVIRATGKD